MSDCFVYLMDLDLEIDPMRQLHKVGISSCPTGRLQLFQTSCPFPIILRHTWRLPDRQSALRVERTFHQRNKHWHYKGEWLLGHSTGSWMDMENILWEFWEEKSYTISAVRRGMMWSGFSAEDVREYELMTFGEVEGIAA